MMSMNNVRLACATAPRFESSLLWPEQFDSPARRGDGDVLDDSSGTPEIRLASARWTAEEMARLARHFIDRTELLMDAEPPPPWEDEDDLFQGEHFPAEETDYRPARRALSLGEKAAILRELFGAHLEPATGDTEVVLLHHGWAMFFRRRLLDPAVSVADKREILKRIYTQEPAEWMDDEAMLARMVLLNECRLLARPGANMDRRQEIMDWIDAPPALEKLPFSFRHCVMACGEPGPGPGEFHERVREELAELLPVWRQEAVAKKQDVLRRRAQRTGQPDLFLD